MHAFILAAGFGTRLRPLTEKVPKPMIPISSEPLIVHQIRWLKSAGITDIVINLHHLGSQIESYLQSGRSFGVNIQYCHEDPILETGGGIVNALPLLKSDPFVVLNGDVWTSYRFKHQPLPADSLAHLILVPTPDDREHGDFTLSEDRVRRPEVVASRNLTYTGIAFLRPRLFDNQQIRPFSLTKDLLFNMLDNDSVTGEVFEGRWIDIGTPEALKQVRRLTA